jgi:hypothetical protein
MKATFEFDSIEEMQSFIFGEGKEVNKMSEDKQGLEDLAEEGVERKEGATDVEPGLDDPSRSAGTGGDVGSRRGADTLSHTSVEEAAREQAEPIDPVTGVDDTRDPESGDEDDE